MKPIEALMMRTAALAPAICSIGANGSTINSSNAAKTVSNIIGAADAWLFAMVVVTNQNANNGTITDNLGGTWNYVAFATNSSPNRGVAIWYRSAKLVDATTVNVTYTPSAVNWTNDGGGLTVVRVDGIRTLGIPQVAQATDPANGIPTLTFPGAMKPNGCCLGIIASTDVAPAVPTGWQAAFFQSSYATPTLFCTTAGRATGQASQSLTWGVAAAQNWCGCAIEIDPD